MFTNTELNQHLENSSTIRLQSAVIAEWNMNIAENIARVGNYRYRLNDTADTKYNVVAQSYDAQDPGRFGREPTARITFLADKVSVTLPSRLTSTVLLASSFPRPCDIVILFAFINPAIP